MKDKFLTKKTKISLKEETPPNGKKEYEKIHKVLSGFGPVSIRPAEVPGHGGFRVGLGLYARRRDRALLLGAGEAARR